MNHPHTNTMVKRTNARAQETARRRPVLAHIDAAYYAQEIRESARNLARRYVREFCPIGGTWFEVTQAEQSRRFGVDKRTIITLTGELEKAGIIWRQRRGTANRTYISHYESRPVDEAGESPSRSEVHEPSSRDLRVLADAAEAAGDERKAAMLLFQAAQAKAREANLSDEVRNQSQEPTAQSAANAFFDSSLGDPSITDKVQSGSPTTLSINSDIPMGDVAMPICPGGGGTATSPPAADNNTQPDTAATRLLRDLGVQDTTALVKFSAAPLDVIERAEQRRQELNASAGLIVKILCDHGHVWSTKPRAHSRSGPTRPDNDQENHHEHQQPEATERDRRRDAGDAGITRANDQSTSGATLVGARTHPFFQQFDTPFSEGTS